MQPAPTVRPKVRWGLGDFFIAWGLGLFASVVAAVAVVGARRPLQLVVLLAAQNGAIVVYLVWAARTKGLGSLRADFGFVVRVRDAWWLLVGIGIQLLSFIPTAILVAVHGEEAHQDVVHIADRARGVEVVLIFLGVAVLAPVVEELLFRGVLLRALLRRTDAVRAVAVSAAVFGLVHLLGDPSVGTLVALPVIMGLGLVSGYQAVRTGELSRSVFLHVGFNLLTVVLLFANV